MAEGEEKGWWKQLKDMLFSGELGKAWDHFWDGVSGIFSGIKNFLSEGISGLIGNRTNKDREGAQRLVDESGEKGRASGVEAARSELDAVRAGTLDEATVKNEAEVAYKQGEIQGRLEEAAKQLKTGKLTQEQYDRYIEAVQKSSGMDDVTFAQIEKKALEGQGVQSTTSADGRARRFGELASAEVERGERDETTGISVVIQGDRASANARFIQDNQKEICNALTAVYDQQKGSFVLKDGKWQFSTEEQLKALPPESTTLTFEGGKWVYKKGDQKAEIDPENIVVATSRSEGLGGPLSFDGDPRDLITRVKGPKLNEHGILEFIETRQYKVENLGKEKIRGEKKSGSQYPMFSAAVLNDEIAAYVASNAFEQASVTLKDNDRGGAGNESLTIKIEDVTPGTPVPAPSPAVRAGQPAADLSPGSS